MKSARKALKVKTEKEMEEQSRKLEKQRAAREDVRKLRGKVEMYPEEENTTKTVSV